MILVNKGLDFTRISMHLRFGGVGRQVDGVDGEKMRRRRFTEFQRIVTLDRVVSHAVGRTHGSLRRVEDAGDGRRRDERSGEKQGSG